MQTSAHSRTIYLTLFIFAVASLLECGKSSKTESTLASSQISPDPTSVVNEKKHSTLFSLPDDWIVFEDLRINEDRRRINIVTNLGSSVTIDIFDHSNAPSREQHIARYIAAILPPETEESSNIDYGDVNRKGMTGLFVNVQLVEPYNSHFFIELFSFKSKSTAAHIIFNTQIDLKDDIKEKIDDFLSSFKLI